MNFCINRMPKNSTYVPTSNVTIFQILIATSTEEFSSLCKAAIFLMKHHHKKYQQQPPIRNRHPPKADQLFWALKCLTTWQGAQFQHCSSYHEQVSSSNLMIPFTQHTGFFSLFKASRRPPRSSSSSSGCWKFGQHLLLLPPFAAMCMLLVVISEHKLN